MACKALDAALLVFAFAAFVAISGCANTTLTEQPEPVRIEDAVGTIDEVLRYKTYGVGNMVEVTPETLRWNEQTHTPFLGWKQRELAFKEIRDVSCGRGASGWTVELDTTVGPVVFETEKPEHAGKLRAAINRVRRGA